MLELGLQANVLLAQDAHRTHVAQADHQLSHRKGLGDEVSRALAHRLYRPVDRSVGGDDHDRRVRAQRLDPFEKLDATEPRHHEIGEHQIVLVLLEQGGALDAVLGHVHRPALLAQGVGHGDPQERLVLDDQQPVSADFHPTSFSLSSSAIAAMMTRNVVPLPTEVSSSIRPPWAATILPLTARPSPVPSPTSRVVKNGSKIRSRISAGIPCPVSRTSAITLPPRTRVLR